MYVVEKPGLSLLMSMKALEAQEALLLQSLSYHEAVSKARAVHTARIAYLEAALREIREHPFETWRNRKIRQICADARRILDMLNEEEP